MSGDSKQKYNVSRLENRQAFSVCCKKIYRNFICIIIAFSLTVYMAKTVGYTQIPAEVNAAGEDRFNPIPIGLNTDYTDPIENGDNQEIYYKVSLPHDGKFTFNVYKYYGSGTFSFNMTTETDNIYVMGGIAQYDSKPYNFESYLSAGNYIIKLGWAANSKYKIKTMFEDLGVVEQIPDSVDNPQTLAINSKHTDIVAESDKEDWFRVDIPQPGKYMLRMSVKDVKGWLNFTVYNSSFTQKIGTGTSANKTDPQIIYYYYFSTGTYYLQIQKVQGSCTYTLEIINDSVDKTNISKVKSEKKKKATIYFKPVKDASGYEIRYTTDKKFKKKIKTKSFPKEQVSYPNDKKVSYTLKKLKSGKTYYFQIRSYVLVDNVKYYSEWSKSKKVKVK